MTKTNASQVFRNICLNKSKTKSDSSSALQEEDWCSIGTFCLPFVLQTCALWVGEALPAHCLEKWLSGEKSADTMKSAGSDTLLADSYQN